MIRKTLFIFTAILLLTACGAGQGSKTIPTVVLDGNSSSGTPMPGAASSTGISASGIVTPERKARLAFLQGGKVKAVNAAIGDKVTKGEILVELENTVAQAQYDQVERTLKELTSDAAIAAAENALVVSQKEEKDAKNRVLTWVTRRGSDDMVDKADSNLTIASGNLDNAETFFNNFKNLAKDNPNYIAALTRLTAARTAYDQAKTNLDYLQAKPTPLEVQKNDTLLAIASAAVKENQWYFSALKGEPIPEEATGIQLTNLQNAKDNFSVAKSALDNTRLISPLDGVLTDINLHEGDFAAPGVVAAAVIDPTSYYVETTDLSELDVPKVEIGQPVSITIKALGETITGKVKAIASDATSLGGDMVYKTIILLDKIPEGLRSGMSVDVEFLSK
jgi:multidrug efflux pump subunit AcrA (membrane-fusion protein)